MGHSPFSNTPHNSHHEVLCSTLRHPGSRLCPVPSSRWPWLRSRWLRCWLRLLRRCSCSLPRCCSRCRCRCSCCCCRCPCCCCSHCPRGDQQPVQSRGRGRQHCLRLPEHQQRRRAARNGQWQRCHRQLLLR